jgi:hypothetical protein
MRDAGWIGLHIAPERFPGRCLLSVGFRISNQGVRLFDVLCLGLSLDLPYQGYFGKTDAFKRGGDTDPTDS